MSTCPLYPAVIGMTTALLHDIAMIWRMKMARRIVSPMSRDGFHGMLAADWPATSKENAIHGRTGKIETRSIPLKSGKIETRSIPLFLFRKKFISIG